MHSTVGRVAQRTRRAPRASAVPCAGRLARPTYASDDDYLAAGQQAIAARAQRLGIVNSGRRPTQADLERVLSAVAQLRRSAPQVTLCASLGELGIDQARRLRKAGLDRYHHNLETSPRVFEQMVTTHRFADRLATLERARAAGLGVCSGGLFGLGETWEDRLELAMVLRDCVRPDAVPINFLTPIPGTPLADRPKLPAMEALCIIAVLRLVMPTADLRICGGRLAVLGDLHSLVFAAGASGLMTGDYLTTTGRRAEDDHRMIEALGLEVAGPG